MSLADTLAAFEAWLHRHAPATAADLLPPATDDDLDQIRNALGVDLPADLLTVLRWHNGSGFGDLPVPLAPGYGMYPSRIMVAATLDNRQIGNEGPYRPWKETWLVIGSDNCGGYLTVETDPSCAGSVFTFDWEDGRPHGRRWPSLADAVATVLAGVRAGRYSDDPDDVIEIEDGFLVP
ncbi:SMI1/KNR4 family protein [Dactylosporangium sp. NPDC000244]|uniref:SMI1/KNR4 family protein n=1 Tax=Dactylosporangium sp. NPDC000244 TaxID=3154365 RepID=UPI0033279837